MADGGGPRGKIAEQEGARVEAKASAVVTPPPVTDWQRLAARLADADEVMLGLIEAQVRQLEQQRQHESRLAAELEEKIASHVDALAHVQGVRAYCATVGANLSGFGFAERRMTLEALDLRVYANGRGWHATGGIPTEQGAGIRLRSSSCREQNARARFTIGGDNQPTAEMLAAD